MLVQTISTPFKCFACRTGTKTVTVDIGARELTWHCEQCGREYQQRLERIKEKDCKKLDEVEQKKLVKLIHMLIVTHELLLPSNWKELLNVIPE